VFTGIKKAAVFVQPRWGIAVRLRISDIFTNSNAMPFEAWLNFFTHICFLFFCKPGGLVSHPTVRLFYVPIPLL
jgi:hypothetical protein